MGFNRNTKQGKCMLVDKKLIQDKEYMDIKEVSDCLKISVRTIHRLKKSGELKSLKWNGRIYFTTGNLMSFLITKGVL